MTEVLLGQRLPVQNTTAMSAYSPSPQNLSTLPLLSHIYGITCYIIYIKTR